MSETHSREQMKDQYVIVIRDYANNNIEICIPDKIFVKQFNDDNISDVENELLTLALNVLKDRGIYGDWYLYPGNGKVKRYELIDNIPVAMTISKDTININHCNMKDENHV